MNSDNLISQPEALDRNCTALYKISLIHGTSLPEPAVHMYLAGVVERANNPENQKMISGFVVGSIDELTKVERKHEHDTEPNAIPYLVGKYSGDFFLNYNAMTHSLKNVVLPSACYDTAQYHGNKIGRKEESRVFSILALNSDRYIAFLANFYEYLNKNPDFKITDIDYRSFKKYTEELSTPKKKIVAPIEIKQRTSKKILI